MKNGMENSKTVLGLYFENPWIQSDNCKCHCEVKILHNLQNPYDFQPKKVSLSLHISVYYVVYLQGMERTNQKFAQT